MDSKKLFSAALAIFIVLLAVYIMFRYLPNPYT